MIIYPSLKAMESGTWSKYGWFIYCYPSIVSWDWLTLPTLWWTNTTMGNLHVQWKNQRTKWQSLAWLCFTNYQRLNLHFPMVFPWFSYEDNLMKNWRFLSSPGSHQHQRGPWGAPHRIVDGTQVVAIGVRHAVLQETRPAELYQAIHQEIYMDIIWGYCMKYNTMMKI